MELEIAKVERLYNLGLWIPCLELVTMGWMLEKVGDWWMMGHCEEINILEGHNGDTVEEGKTWERGRRGEELELKRKLVLVEDEEEIMEQ